MLRPFRIYARGLLINAINKWFRHRTFKADGRIWTADRSITNRMLYHWATPAQFINIATFIKPIQILVYKLWGILAYQTLKPLLLSQHQKIAASCKDWCIKTKLKPDDELNLKKT